MCIACLGSCGFLFLFLFRWKKDLLGVEKKLLLNLMRGLNSNCNNCWVLVDIICAIVTMGCMCDKTKGENISYHEGQ